MAGLKWPNDVIRAMRQTYGDDQRFTRSNVEHHLILAGHTTG